jgi:thiaminase (transcriptional activator TenA)
MLAPVVLWLSLAAQASSFTDELWREAAPVFAKTMEHPFLRGVENGTLPREKFRFYMRQDALYLGHFGALLKTLAGRTPRKDYQAFFTKGSQNTINVEQQLHKRHFTPGELERTEMAPSNVAYVNHMLASAQGSFAEGVAGVLPCYWVYWEVGRELKRRGAKSPDAEYQRWIDQYAADAFGASVKTIRSIMDAEAARLTPAQRAKVKGIFLRGVRYEYMFWDMAWRQEEWLP